MPMRGYAEVPNDLLRFPHCLVVVMLAALMGWRGYAAAALAGALVAGPAAWTVQTWRYDARIAGMEVSIR